MPLSAREIREEFLAFFESKAHQRVASAPLVPDSDPSLMFVNAGMVPFKRTFLGDERRAYTRATSSQKCMRVSGKHNDLENVGRSASHHTFFEMLGNFSFGDYFKVEAIEYAWELVTSRFGLSPENLVVSVFREDDEAFGIWRDTIGLPEEKIYRLDEDENFWSMAETGPCGPCSEIHVDRGPVPGWENDDPSSDSGRFLEFWNLVFMQFNRDAAGKMEPLPKPCVDTGMGLERMASLMQGVESNYETDLFTPILARAQEVSGVSLGQDAEKDVSLQVVADHARALTFLVGDGVLPSNEGRGYVLRRILRRACRHGVLLGLERPFLSEVADVVIDEMNGVYPELAERRAFVVDRIRKDEERFLETLARGLSLLEDEIVKAQSEDRTRLSGGTLFRLYDTYGFPVDLTEDILQERGMTADLEGFEESMQAQRARARAAWKGSGDTAVDEVYARIRSDVSSEFCGYEALACQATVKALLVDGEPVERVREGDEVELITGMTPFYAESGGQVGDQGRIVGDAGSVRVEDTQKPVDGLIVHRGRVHSGELHVGQSVELEVDRETREATVRNHSGTHLLHAALREVLGPQTMQQGSLVGPDRLRFDFTHDEPLEDEQLQRIEEIVNRWIEANLPGSARVVPYQEAIGSGAMALFEEKYGDEVRVLSFGDVSTELCGGTHAAATGDIGLLKVLGESGIAAGVRRIEALTGMGALGYIRGREAILTQTANLLRSKAEEVPTRVEKLLEERRASQREIERLKTSHQGQAATDWLAAAKPLENGGRALGVRVEGVDAKAMRTMVDDLRNRLESGVVMLISENGGKVLLAVGVTKDLVETVRAGDLVRETAAVVGGKGGGRADFAQAGGRDAGQIDRAIERFHELLGVA